MSHSSCVAAHSVAPRFAAPTALLDGCPSASDSHSVSFKPIFSSRIPTLNIHENKRRSSAIKVLYSNVSGTIGASERRGLWSIRDDLLVPSSPFLSVYARGPPPGPPPMVAERFRSVISQLFQYRIVRCGGPVDDDMANIIVAQLLYLDAVNPKKDIVMYINSPGGSVTAGMAIFDTMKHIRPDVSTVCVGLAASIFCYLVEEMGLENLGIHCENFSNNCNSHCTSVL